MRGIKSKEGSKWKRIVVFFALLVILGLLLNSLNKVYKKKKEADKILVRMEEQMAELQKRDRFLKDSLQKLTTEEGIEFEIRKKLNVAEVGESVAIIVEEEPVSPAAKIEFSFWQKFKNFFADLFE